MGRQVKQTVATPSQVRDLSFLLRAMEGIRECEAGSDILTSVS